MLSNASFRQQVRGNSNFFTVKDCENGKPDQVPFPVIVHEAPQPDIQTSRLVWSLLNKVVSGIIFIVVLTWALPVGFANTIGRFIPAGRPFSVASFLGMPGGTARADATAGSFLSRFGQASEAVPSAENAGYMTEKPYPEAGNGEMGAAGEAQGNIEGEQKQTLPPFRVTGIVCGAGGGCIAIINGEIVRQDDIIGGYRIRAIAPGRVIVSSLNGTDRRYGVGM